MNDLDLESKIKSVSVPECAPEFSETLPRRVLAAAKTGSAPQLQVSPVPISLFTILNSKFLMACLVAGLCLWQSRMPQAVSRELVKDGREMRQALAQLPNHLDTFMRDEHGLHNLIQDPP
jgi:hypothetical protein